MLDLTQPSQESQLAPELPGAATLPHTETQIIPLNKAALVPPTAAHEVGAPNRYAAVLGFIQQYPKLSVLLTALTVATLSLATWLGALFFENKVLQARLAQQQQALAHATAANADALKSRLSDAQQQMTQLQSRMEQQQTDQLITDQATLAGENAKLVQDLNQLSQPQAGAPIVPLNPNRVKLTENPQLKDFFTPLDVPHNLVLFTVVLQQAQENSYQTYHLELSDAKAKGLTWSDKLPKPATAMLPLTFAKRSLAAGKYRLKLFGLNGKKKEPIDEYDFQVNYLAPPAPPKKAGKRR